MMRKFVLLSVRVAHENVEYLKWNGKQMKSPHRASVLIFVVCTRAHTHRNTRTTSAAHSNWLTLIGTQLRRSAQ